MNKTTVDNKKYIKTKIEMYLTKNAETRFIQRLQILHYLIEHEEQSSITVGELFHVSPRAILNWLKKISETGNIESLRDKPGSGRKTRLTQKQSAQIKKALQSEPANAGINADEWSGKTLSKYISKKMSVTLQDRQCQRILLRMGFSKKRGRPKKAAE